MKLTKRLKLLLSLVPFGARVCDVGTDHGYLSIELIKTGGVKSVIATDINEKPLSRARKNIERAGVTGIDLRLCDGLSDVNPEETDTVVIAGMGGEVISGIIEKGSNVLKNTEKIMILQPTTSPEHLRKFLFENGYEIILEEPLYENRKAYSVMVCRYKGDLDKKESYNYFIGKVNPEKADGALYIKKQYERVFKCAKALKDIPEKKADFEFYNSAAEQLRSILKL